MIDKFDYPTLEDALTVTGNMRQKVREQIDKDLEKSRAEADGDQTDEDREKWDNALDAKLKEIGEVTVDGHTFKF